VLTSSEHPAECCTAASYDAGSFEVKRLPDKGDAFEQRGDVIARVKKVAAL
jgi:hypothetical protein